MPACSVARRVALGAWAAAAALSVASLASASDPTTVTLTLKDHQFTPPLIHVPANTPITLVIRNQDTTAEEIDSPALKIEKVIPGGQEGKLTLRPLKQGTYPFAGEFHSDTAQGQLIVD
jgi:heme/copper-type cytochrome/quinol oxidase subunit 2